MLVRKAKEARKTEQARRLAVEADKIAQILNEDFKRISERLHEIRAASSRKGSAQAQFGARATDETDEEWVKGTQQPGDIAKNKDRAPEPGPEPHPGPAPLVQPQGRPNSAGDNAVDPVGGADGKRRRPRGRFRVEYRNLGKGEERSLYDPPTLTILINLDHPLVSAALGDGNIECELGPNSAANDRADTNCARCARSLGRLRVDNNRAGAVDLLNVARKWPASLVLALDT